ncbi:MAG TPA: LPS export ABC transporter periplasmic protein LptC, partial [Steroidobacteraceae bacterium]
MKRPSRPFAVVAVIAAVGIAYFLGRPGRDDGSDDVVSGSTADPGYAAREATVIETGYDGRERYRLNASVIRQQTESGVIELEKLAMDYHPDRQNKLPGESAPASIDAGEVWHLTSDHGLVRADGDDVQLTGNVRVTGPAPGTGEPLSLTTDTLRINTPTEYIETYSKVILKWSGYELRALGLKADLKAGTLR